MEPSRDCPLCPRLAAFREAARSREPGWFNAPVPSFGGADGRLLVVGLAPGLRGANRTGRPFTGDFAGDLLYETLVSCGLASGRYDRRPDDGLILQDCTITNAVRCVPPENKPLPAEIATCRPFLAAQVAAMPRLEVIVALGRVAHDSVLKVFGAKLSAHPFGHGRRHAVGDSLVLLDSFHCSRYNTSTKLLTPEMFRAVLAEAAALVASG